MKYIKYAVLAILSLIIDWVFSRFFLNWIVAAFANKEGNLPKYLKWFQTFDASLDEGMYARRNELQYNKEMFVEDDVWKAFNPYPKNWWETYLNRGKWLFRNSCYGFDYYLLGIEWKPEEWTKVEFYNTNELVKFKAVSPNAFNYYYHGKWGMYKFGWKAWNQFDPRNGFGGTWGPSNRLPIVFSANPFKHT